VAPFDWLDSRKHPLLIRWGAVGVDIAINAERGLQTTEEIVSMQLSHNERTSIIACKILFRAADMFAPNRFSPTALTWLVTNTCRTTSIDSSAHDIVTAVLARLENLPVVTTWPGIPAVTRPPSKLPIQISYPHKKSEVKAEGTALPGKRKKSTNDADSPATSSDSKILNSRERPKAPPKRNVFDDIDKPLFSSPQCFAS
jgi:hypothetical protein